MQIFTLKDIKARINLDKIISMQETGFQDFSAGKVEIPPVVCLNQYNPPGSYHIKCGLIDNDNIWVVKVAGGPNHLPLNGIMIIMSTSTGQPVAILQDNGYLTQLRTAIAGLISAKYLAPKEITNIGVIGTGEQARMQLVILKKWTTCRDVYVWGRSLEQTLKYKRDMEKEGFQVCIVTSTCDIARKCNLIVTTTSAQNFILKSSEIRSGTHITAIGADASGKIELEPTIIGQADIVMVDSKNQCVDHGEIHQAYKQGLISEKNLVELGKIIEDQTLGRTNKNQITVADLTGVAIQDIQIAKAIIEIP